MKKKPEKSVVWNLIVVLSLIAAGVSAVVYLLATHRRYLDREKWKDYDECGIS